MKEGQPLKYEQLKKYFVEETNNFIPYRQEVRSAINNVAVPTKDEKPDTEKYISNIASAAESVLTKHWGNGRDPDWNVFLDELFGRLRGYTNIYQDSKLRETVLNAIIDDYVNKSQQRVLSRGVGRGRSLTTFEEQKAYNLGIAKGDPALEDLVNDARTPEELLARSPTLHNAVLARKLQGHDLTGKVYQM